MPKAIRIHEHGGPDVLQWEDVEIDACGAGEVLLAHRAVGLNFIDTYHRTGLYPVGSLPSGLGMEAAGVVEALGEGVTDLVVGDRVAYAGGGPPNAYSEKRVIAADRLVPIPDGIDDETAAAMMLKGMTAEYLLHRTVEVQKGDSILVHAAAGGVGSILCQWGRALGATVIGTVSTAAKAEAARAWGCAHPIVTGDANAVSGADFVAEVARITGGAGADVVYDSVGVDTFERSLDCLRPRGLLVAYGQSSGKVPPFDPLLLSAKGSLYLTRPSLMVYNAKREDLLLSARTLFDAVERGDVTIAIGQRYELSRAGDAHRDLEARKTTGSTVLLP